MKKALIIFAAVAGYCVFEVVVLLSNLVPDPSALNPGPRQLVLLGIQLVLIPGMAALFSRLVYGPARWGKRVLIILAVGAGGPLLLLAITVVIDGESRNGFLFVVGLTILIGICFLLPVAIRKIRGWGVQLEAARWLAERQSGVSDGERRWRSRSVRWSLWIPPVTVLLVFLFLPQSWGIVSHLLQPRAGEMGPYRVSIPLTWIILDHAGGTEYSESRVTGLAGQDLASAVKQYREGNSPLFSWDIGLTTAESNAWLPQDDQVIAQRVLTVGDASVTCAEHQRSYLHQPDRIQHSSFVHVVCSGSNRLYAGFDGARGQLPVFYRMLEGIRQERQR